MLKIVKAGICKVAMSSCFNFTLSAAALLVQPAEPVRKSSIDLIFIVDTSASMMGKGGGRLVFPEVKHVLKDWIGTCKVGDRVLLISYDSDLQVRPTAQILGDSDKEALCREIDRMDAKGPWTYTAKALEKGVSEAEHLDIVEKEQGTVNPKVVVLLTDGQNDPPPGVRGTDSEVKLESVATRCKDKPWFVWQVQVGRKVDQQVDEAFKNAEVAHYEPIQSGPGKLDEARRTIQEKIQKEAQSKTPVLRPPPRASSPQANESVNPKKGRTALLAILAALGVGLLLVIIRALLNRPKPHGTLELYSKGASQTLEFDLLQKANYLIGPSGSDMDLGLSKDQGFTVRAIRQSGQVLCVIEALGSSVLYISGDMAPRIELYDHDEFQLEGSTFRYIGNTGPRI